MFLASFNSQTVDQTTPTAGKGWTDFDTNAYPSILNSFHSSSTTQKPTTKTGFIKNIISSQFSPITYLISFTLL